MRVSRAYYGFSFFGCKLAMKGPTLVEPRCRKGRLAMDGRDAALAPGGPDGFSWPRISIVTPSCNHGQFIEEMIRSVLLQGYWTSSTHCA
jgi:hypothetical protein